MLFKQWNICGSMKTKRNLMINNVNIGVTEN